MTGGPYGEAKALQGLQEAAPMAAEGPSAPVKAAQGPPREPVNVTGFDAPSAHPDEPVTAGAPTGAGVGPEAMGLGNPMQQADQRDAQRMLEYLPVLEFVANQPGASNAMKSYVRWIKAMNV